MKKIAKVLIVFSMIFAMFGSTTQVFAAPTVDLVGLATTGASVQKTADEKTRQPASDTPSQNNANNNMTTQTQPQGYQTSTTTVSSAETGVSDQVLPFAVAFSFAGALLTYFLIIFVKRAHTEDRVRSLRA